MLVAVKNIQDGQIIRDASERQVIVKEKIPIFMDNVVRTVILNGVLVWDGSPWSSHFSNPDEEVEVVMSNSNG